MNGLNVNFRGVENGHGRGVGREDESGRECEVLIMFAILRLEFFRVEWKVSFVGKWCVYFLPLLKGDYSVSDRRYKVTRMR